MCFPLIIDLSAFWPNWFPTKCLSLGILSHLIYTKSSQDLDTVLVSPLLTGNYIKLLLGFISLTLAFESMKKNQLWANLFELNIEPWSIKLYQKGSLA